MNHRLRYRACYPVTRERDWVCDEYIHPPVTRSGERCHCFSSFGDHFIVVPPSGGCFTILSRMEALSYIRKLLRHYHEETPVMVFLCDEDGVFADEVIQLDALESSLRQCAGIRTLN